MTGGGGATFMGFFKEVLREAELVYQTHEPEKGDSWRTCDIQFLEDKLADEVREVQNATLVDGKFKEILDVINIALMLGVRLDKERQEEWRRTPVR